MKLRKAILCAVAAAAMSTACYAQDINVSLNGNIVSFPNQQPVVVEGRTLIPLRGVFDNMGYSIDWDGETKTVTLKKNSDTLKIAIGQASIDVNGASTAIDVPAQIINGSTMLPLRAIATATGAEVLWDADSKTATILDDNMAKNMPNEVQVLLNSQEEADAVAAYSAAIKELNDSSVAFTDYFVAASENENLDLNDLKAKAQKAYDDAVAAESKINGVNIPAEYSDTKTSVLKLISSYKNFTKLIVDFANGDISPNDYLAKLNSVMTEYAQNAAAYQSVVESLQK
ncbi:MAG: copper amine oxidase N-terminal domain-containing protein [Firmicutes bacterium]|nr:copper amine oxidase N-terminal domain-containing protein [Bacillota bacterium]